MDLAPELWYNRGSIYRVGMARLPFKGMISLMAARIFLAGIILILTLPVQAALAAPIQIFYDDFGC